MGKGKVANEGSLLRSLGLGGGVIYCEIESSREVGDEGEEGMFQR